jgi:hypothetical protein
MGGVVNAVSTVVSFTILGWLTKGKKPKDTIQRIGDLAEQTAKEGEPRPIVWGRVRPIRGNIMHVSTPRIVRQEVKGQSSGGKGGKKKQPKQYQERVFRTYAIRICEGPITAIVRVWRNNKLVYDARGNDWGEKNNGVFLKLARFYLGGWDQMPDPTLESIWGAGDVPGYRGTCYMVVGDEDLTELGGTVPQYTFEVERAEGTYLTSKPYAVDSLDSANMATMDPPLLVFRASVRRSDFNESISANHAAPSAINLRAMNISITQDAELLQAGYSSPQSLNLSEVIPPEPVILLIDSEKIEAQQAAAININLRQNRLSYSTDIESINLGSAAPLEVWLNGN